MKSKSCKESEHSRNHSLRKFSSSVPLRERSFVPFCFLVGDLEFDLLRAARQLAAVLANASIR